MRKSAVRNRALVAAAAVASCAVVIVPGASPAEAAQVTVTLLNINDFHGRIDTTNNLTTRWATTIEQERLVDSEALLFGAGDLIGATLFTSAVAQDQPTIDVLNALGVDATAIGTALKMWRTRQTRIKLLIAEAFIRENDEETGLRLLLEPMFGQGVWRGAKSNPLERN